MSRGINKVILVGNLGQDPELRYTGTGTAVCNMRLATSERYNDADGNPVEKTEWHNVVAWGRLAEICGEYLKKGSQAYFEGSLQTRSYDDKEGVTRYVTDVKVREMLMLGGRGGGGNGDYDGGQYSSNAGVGARQGGASKPQDSGQKAPQTQPSEGEFTPDDDLPF